MKKELMAAAALLIACGGSKPPAATTASGAHDLGPEPATSASANANSLETPTQASSSGTINISDEIRRACGISDADAYFAFDSSHLTSHDIKALNQVAACFTGGALKGQAVRLVGRADPRGTPDYNMTLGQARADAVGRYLDDKGMDKTKTLTTSRGAMDATGTTETTWAKDRRVDVLLGR